MSPPARWRPVAVAALLVVAATGVVAFPVNAGGPLRTTGTAQAPSASGNTSPVSDRAPFSVRLITGDTVRVTPLPAGRHAASITPGLGRRGMAFTTTRTREGLRVVPADAQPLLAADRLDARLFDVLLLDRLGHRSGDIPVLLTGARKAPVPTGAPAAAKNRSATPAVPAARAGTSTIRTLPGLGVRSARVTGSETRRFWAATQAAARQKPGEKVWLNGRRRLDLDRSVAQIGAPAAWQTGLTGKGVTVAVLDSGYDPTHPDLEGAVTTSRDFTGSPEGVKDTVGHGTHVASTIAGRGAASGGRYVGVAKGATLAVGKVCATRECPDDAVLAGMQWAATEARAKVVNLSLGDAIAPGVDPLEQAIETLTAQTGTLFVASAGNDGPGPYTVGSPGSAPSALSVGSVGRTDDLSGFSSRGPAASRDRTGPYSLKPEITAPGEDIVAARAEGTDEDLATGPGNRYVALSGTSMASPHVAGAAALLAQQHPGWTAAQLKAALTATARPATSATVYQQGAGRVDVARAVTATVTASTGILDFGYAPWPRTSATPTTRSISYHNSGPKPVTLSLTATLNGPDGKPVNPAALVVRDRTLTVPAGGAASTTVTFRPPVGVTGEFSGRLTARDADARELGAAIGAFVEPEAYNVSVSGIGRTEAEVDTQATLIDRAKGTAIQVTATGKPALQRVPAGTYTLVATVTEGDADPPVQTVERREIRIAADTAIVIDARRGVPLKATLDRRDAVPGAYENVLFDQQTSGWGVQLGAATAPGRLFVVPGGAIEGLSASLATEFVKKGTDGAGKPPTPFVYHVVTALGATVPQDPTVRLRGRDFAAVRNVYARQGTGEDRITSAAGFLSGQGMAVSWGRSLEGLSRRTDYLLAEDVVWSLSLVSAKGELGAFLTAPDRTVRPGERITDSWNRAVFGPALRQDPTRTPTRTGDSIAGTISLLSDAAGHSYGAPWTDRYTARLLRDGKQIWTGGGFPGDVEATVPADAGTYRLEMALEHPVPWTTLASRSTVAWTFRSQQTDGDTPEVLPLSVIRFTPRLDGLNRAQRGQRLTVPVRVDRAPGAAATTVRTLTVDVSFDRGRTWTEAEVAGTGAARSVAVRHPATAGSVSLRATAVNADGTRVEQTTIDAYLLR